MDHPLIQAVRDFLESQNVHYRYLAYAGIYSDEKIQFDDPTLERTLLETVLVQIQHNDALELAIIVVPATRRIDLESLKKILGNKRIEFVSKSLAEQYFPDQAVEALLPFQHFHPEVKLYFSQEILHLTDVNFCIQNSSNFIKMPLADFLTVAAPVNWLDVATISKYKVEVAQIFPTSQRSALHESGHCMLGFSLQSQSFAPTKLAGMVEWISRHFSECSVLIGDGIHRITLEINGMSPEYTANRALLMGREIIDGDAMLFKRHKNNCQFHVISTAELQKTASYHHFHQALCRLFHEDEAFKRSVMQFARDFVSHQHYDSVERLTYCQQLSCQYLLEEVAITAMLLQQGVSVFVYPGTLTIMQELSLGQHPSAPREFERLISVNLRLKRR